MLQHHNILKAPQRLQAKLPALTVTALRTSAPHSRNLEIRICTNRICTRQSGREVLATLGDLAPPPPHVEVASCGCLGHCGAGPNVAASVPVRGTAARTARILEHLLGAAEFDAGSGIAALVVREKAEAALVEGNAAEAEALSTENIGLDAPGQVDCIWCTGADLIEATAGSHMGLRFGAYEYRGVPAKIVFNMVLASTPPVMRS